jgi:hypothetical protein
MINVYTVSITVVGKTLSRRDYLEDLSVDVEVILKHIFSQNNMGECGVY